MPVNRHRQKPRYDGHAAWYDEFFVHCGDLSEPGSSSSLLARWLGPGTGPCLDIACGGGLHHAAITSTGRSVVGIDLSGDQLMIANGRTRDLVRGDAVALPFPAATFETAVCTYLHTDIDDIAPVFVEANRVLRPGGVFVYAGVHPCFWGHFVETPGATERVIHPGYSRTGWIDSPFWRNPVGLRARVGARHATISELINALIAAGLRIVELEEHPGRSGHVDRIAILSRTRNRQGRK